ncbi:TPA: hypothetical protein ACX6PR_000427 [Photobacterium damselae]
MKKRIWIPIVGLVLVSFTSIPRVTYYKAMKYVLEPSIWNESVVITGTKPESVQIRGSMIFRWCGIYESNRIYDYTADDLGTSYRLELPVINKDSKCQRTLQISVNTIGNPYERYYTGWSIKTYNISNDSWASPTYTLQDSSIISLNCPSKGICYYIGKNFNDMEKKLKDGTIEPLIVSQENINSLTHLTINFGK